jgi:NADPH-dependent 2,4-dienoyl-CoA reductase/sulfur reductase-like enzyme
VIHRRDELRASRIMAERVLEHPKIEVLWNKKVAEVLGYEQITLRLEDTETGEQRARGGRLFVAIGHTPNTAFLDGQLELTEHGYIRTKSWRTATSVDGVFAAGDVMDDYYRQAVTAAGTGLHGGAGGGALAVPPGDRRVAPPGDRRGARARGGPGVASGSEDPADPLPEAVEEALRAPVAVDGQYVRGSVPTRKYSIRTSSGGQPLGGEVAGPARRSGRSPRWPAGPRGGRRAGRYARPSAGPRPARPGGHRWRRA